ncbi:sensor domain-containing protein [Chrysiogenes arsenatis]|uniref:sensor domain-containing protein n=1 Tax=Chrysiogenes arsenatis TaxID=309797 RepID=UPI000422C92D|nr:EAL domain-containing protein [Chrysiogenes arsenatis]
MTPFDKRTISSAQYKAPLEQYNFSHLRVRSLLALATLLVATLLLLGIVIWQVAENEQSILWKIFPLIAVCFVIITVYASFMLNRMFTMAKKLQYSASSLIESEGVFRTLFEDSATPALIIARGMFVDANSAALNILECHDKSQLIGLSPQRISPHVQPDGKLSSAKIESLLAAALAGKSLLFEWCHRKFDGTDLHVEVLFSPIQLHGHPVLHVTWRDITLHKRLETQFQNIFACSPFGILVFASVDEDLVLENINPAAQRILHLDTAMIGRTVDGNEPHLLDDDILQRLRAIALSGEAWHTDHFRRETVHGTHDYSLHAFALSHKTVALTLYDTTQQHYLTEELEQRLRYEKALSLISHALLVQRLDDPLSEILHILLDAAHAGRVYIFLNFEDPHDGLCTGQTHEACAPEVTPEINNPLLRHIPYSDPMIARWRTELEQGRPILGLTETFPDEEREILEAQGIRSLLVIPLMRGSEWMGFIGFDDVLTQRQWDAISLRLLHTGAELIGAYFERKYSEGKIHNLAFFDPLTKLPNRRLLVDRLQHALASSERHNVFGGLIFIDLDHFKKINDTYGHQTGDLYLQSIAQRLLVTVRKSDTVARMGGDEFVILLEDLHHESSNAVTGAELIAENVLDIIKQPFLLGDNEYAGSASVGVTLFRGFDDGVEELLRRADSAMYRAKGFGRSAIRFYDPAMQAAQDERITMENQLRMAIRNNELRLFYQVQMDSAHRPVGAEALLRWVHPEHGMILPGSFISLAEETGLIVPIGQWVLEEACQQIKLWEATAWGQHLPLAINVSARQFRQSDFVDQLKSVLVRTGANPCCLKLELTETLVINDVSNAIAKMHQLKQIGIGFSMDDFGTGYSSLSYLRQLPLDQLKIDRSFICDMLVKPSDAVIVQTIIAMAKSLELEVIAEGVETEEQRELLSGFGCTLFQGYLFSRPLPLGEFEVLLRHSPW